MERWNDERVDSAASLSLLVVMADTTAQVREHCRYTPSFTSTSAEWTASPSCTRHTLAAGRVTFARSLSAVKLLSAALAPISPRVSQLPLPSFPSLLPSPRCVRNLLAMGREWACTARRSARPQVGSGVTGHKLFGGGHARRARVRACVTSCCVHGVRNASSSSRSSVLLARSFASFVSVSVCRWIPRTHPLAHARTMGQEGGNREQYVSAQLSAQCSVRR